MAEIITCSECQRRLQVPESFLGQAVQCPECGHKFTAQIHPEAVQKEAPPPPAPSPPPPSMDDSDPDIRHPRRRRGPDDDYDDDLDDLRPMRRRGIPNRGGTILALGIIAWVVFPYTTWICGPIAWFMGNTDLARIQEGEMDPNGEGMVQAGRILGMVATIVSIVIIAFVCFIFALMSLN